MLECEGYKMFRGTMKIAPKAKELMPYEETCTWLYKPEYDCWYGRGRSYMAEICKVVEDETEVLNE